MHIFDIYTAQQADEKARALFAAERQEQGGVRVYNREALVLWRVLLVNIAFSFRHGLRRATSLTEE